VRQIVGLFHLPNLFSDDFLVAFVHSVDKLFIASTDWCEFKTRLSGRVVCCKWKRWYCFRSVMAVGDAPLGRSII
jgi:hypothetical protein